jgi:hypothetical protein
MNRRKTLGLGAAGMIAIALVAGGCMRKERATAAMSEVAASAPAAAPARDGAPAGERRERPAAGSMREIRAQISVEIASMADARASLEALARVADEHGGFVASSAYGRDQGRTQMQLKVPPAALLDVRRVAASLGAITQDDESSTDVTEAVTDLDARLRSARTEEARLLTLIEQRTGTIADVLAADRTLADVRERIEKLDAESHAAHARVDLATIDVVLAPRVVAVAFVAPTVGSRISAAAKDGAEAAGDLAMAVATVTLRAGPSASIFGLIGLALFAAVRRWRARRVVASAA